MGSCYIHKQCFFDWSTICNALKDIDHRDAQLYGKDAPFWLRHDIEEHIATDELTKDYTDEPVGAATAIAYLHTKRIQGDYKEADRIKEAYNIQILPNGYLALRKKW